MKFSEYRSEVMRQIAETLDIHKIRSYPDFDSSRMTDIIAANWAENRVPDIAANAVLTYIKTL